LKEKDEIGVEWYWFHCLDCAKLDG